MGQNDQYRQHRTSVVVNFKNEISAEGFARKLCENYLHQPSLSIGVRGGWSEGGRPPPRVWNISGLALFSGQALVAQKSWMIKKYFNTVKNCKSTIFFRTCASCSKILNDKKYIFNTVKNSRATLFFRASASCSKILNNKKYIFSTVNSGHPLFFRASANCSKLLNVKSILNTVKNFRGNSVFQGKCKLLKILNVKIYSLQWKFPGQLCFVQGKR